MDESPKQQILVYHYDEATTRLLVAFLALFDLTAGHTLEFAGVEHETSSTGAKLVVVPLGYNPNPRLDSLPNTPKGVTAGFTLPLVERLLDSGVEVGLLIEDSDAALREKDDLRKRLAFEVSWSASSAMGPWQRLGKEAARLF